MGGQRKPVVLGKSLIVPSVRELAKDCVNEIPERYHQLNHDPPFLSLDHDDGLEVPTINMEALISGDKAELHKLHLACQEWGFFQLTKHGISSSLLDKFKQETIEFFELPMEEKKKYWQTSKDVEGYGQAFIQSDDQKLDWGDMFYLTTYPPHLQRPHLFPLLPLPYRDTLKDYSIELQKLTKKILDYMAKALNIGLGGEVFGEGHQSMRMNYYPPCPQPEKTIGLAPHSDGISLITILLQLNEIEGLQIKKNNKWIRVTPSSNAFVINVGDIMEIMSNGIYRSVAHRAIVNASKERLSVATFHGPALENEIGPISELITPSTPSKFKKVSVLDYWKGFLERPLVGKSYLDLMRITNGNNDHKE